jgi:transcription elongation factor SPT6
MDTLIPGTPVTPSGRNTQRTPYMTGTPGGITPGAMSMAGVATPYGATPGGGYNINTPYTPSGQTPILTPYNTPGPSNTPRSHMAPPPVPHGMPPPPPSQRRSGGYQPSPGYGRSPAGAPPPGRPVSREDSWQTAVDGWARGRNRTPRNDGQNTPKGTITISKFKFKFKFK